VLVVDDNEELAENLAEILNGVGYEARVAVSVEAATTELHAGGCDAVITDFRLPGKSGVDLILALREAGSRIPVVMMSAYTDQAMIESAEAAGAIEVLPKPVDIGRLLGLMETLRGGGDEVLIVDDDKNLVENLAEVLRGQGLRAVVGLSAGEALAHRRPMAAALIDYRLPDQDGLHVAERSSVRFPGARILLFSAHCDEARRAEVHRRLPNVECVQKPIDLQRLLAWAAGASAGGFAAR